MTKSSAVPVSQKHLGYEDRVNLGSCYTPPACVRLAWEMLAPRVDSETVILDSACGYGRFLESAWQRAVIGCDLDEAAVAVARRSGARARFFQANSLRGVRRSKFGVPEGAKLAVVGNPPYNDRTSLIRRGIKSASFDVDEDIARRDLGLSFLLSYDKLKADLVCVLHPLSYLIKPANFRLLGSFAANYRLTEGLLISSGEFPESAGLAPFPIAIALYARDPEGMAHDFIRAFRFKTGGAAHFRLDDFDYVSRYIDKYPRRRSRAPAGREPLFFWTMRDVNALRRNRTFVQKRGAHTIEIDEEKLDYYAYVDVFKRNLHRLPFYFGNCDVMIDDESFRRHRDWFMLDAVNHHPHLKGWVRTNLSPDAGETETRDRIDGYFRRLLGEHHAG